METQTSDSFTESDFVLVEQALEALTPFRDEAPGITLRRQAAFRVGTKIHPTVMAVYLPPSRTATLFNGAFAGVSSVMPLSTAECLRAVLSVGLLADPAVRTRWCKVLGVAPGVPTAAAVIEAHAVASLIATPETARLDLESLGPETAFALAMGWGSCRPRWFAKRRPDMAAFTRSLSSLPFSPIRC